MENVQLVTENATGQPIPFNAIKDGPHDERLSTSEIGSLWETYLYNATSKCQLQYFVNKAQDPKIRAVLQYASRTCRYTDRLPCTICHQLMYSPTFSPQLTSLLGIQR